jgi:hypothetical protein
MKSRLRPQPKANPFAPPLEPSTETEWQVCADVANVALTLDMARNFGLIDDQGRPNVNLCAKRLREALDRGITPRTLGPGQTTP